MGLGFVGLTTAVGFASKGFNVYCYDINSKKLSNLKRGIIEFYEPGLQDLINVNIDRLHFLEDLTLIDANLDLIFVCVGTPYNKDGSANLSYLFSAIDSLDKIPFDLLVDAEVVIKSTVPPGTTKQINEYIQGSTRNKGLKLYNNPEFLREGFALKDFLSPDRIVIGSFETSSQDDLKIIEVYKNFNSDVIITNYNTSEFVKYLSNTLLSTLISFSNEMSMIADYIGDIEIKKAFETLHKDFRWNKSSIKSYIYPGFGYGGYCLPKDTMALRAVSISHGYNPKMLSSNLLINDEIMEHIIVKIKKLVTKKSRIGLLGLSFKPGSDDIRETKSYVLLSKLLESGYQNIICHDPLALDKFRIEYSNLDLDYESNLQRLISNVDAVIIATPWDEYFDFISDEVGNSKIVIDLKYLIYNFINQ